METSLAGRVLTETKMVMSDFSQDEWRGERSGRVINAMYIYLQVYIKKVTLLLVLPLD